MASFQSLDPRHIQDFSDAKAIEPHWGYADREVPCDNDPGSCAYLDVVYNSHDRSMLYSGIIWATIGGILLLWVVGRTSLSSKPAVAGLHSIESGIGIQRGGLRHMGRATRAIANRYLLPDFVQAIFGRTTRLQVLILAVLAGYVLIWSFAGIVYNTWVTPIEDSPGLYNTRVSMGPWSNRIGVLAYALTPLSILLSSRESLLSIITGIPYQSFNFLHRWLGYIIFVQSFLHTVAWCVIEMRLYQPQPTTGIEWIEQKYMIYGVVAMFLLLVLVILSTPWGIRMTGYETFRKAHYLLAMLFIGGCWGHWEPLRCFMIPSLILWTIDRAIRLIRTALLHYQYLPDTGSMGFRAATAAAQVFEDHDHGHIVRIDLEHNQDAWNIGQHFYLCFPTSTIWQSHPFTPCSLPSYGQGRQTHSYIFRAKSGETKKIADSIIGLSAQSAEKISNAAPTTQLPVILNGPYGESTMDTINASTNVLCIAGGTGITYVLPVLLNLLHTPISTDRQIALIWTVRKASDVRWIKEELDTLTAHAKAMSLAISIFVTREDDVQSGETDALGLQDKDKSRTYDTAEVEISSSSSASGSSSPHGPAQRQLSTTTITSPSSSHKRSRPHLDQLVKTFVSDTVRGPTTVIASGPGEMLSDLRRVVAAQNSGLKVWRGDEKGLVRLVCDDRLEW